MALKTNVFTEDLALLHNTLADYGHYQLFVRWQLEQASKGIERSMAVLEKGGDDKKAFHKRNPDAIKVEGQPAYFQMYVDYACARDATRALDTFDKFLAMDRFVRRAVAWPQMSWREYVGAIAICRHLIVHNYGRV